MGRTSVTRGNRRNSKRGRLEKNKLRLRRKSGYVSVKEFQTGEVQHREEGYDGHFEWKRDLATAVLIHDFRNHVINERNIEVMNIFKDLGVSATDNQLCHICDLLIMRNAEPLKEALLTSICIGSRPMVEMVLSLFHEFPFEEYQGCADSPAFLPHITPIVLAGILNNFAIMECLLLRGHTISVPHHRNCNCEPCLMGTNSNLGAIRRVDMFRALASDAYLWLATEDPFIAACNISTDLLQCMREDNLEFMETYRLLHENVQVFSMRMVEQCWKVEECDLFLSQKEQCFLKDCRNPYPRLRMGLDHQMKMFASSVNVQRCCDAMWTKGWGETGGNMKRDVWRFFRHFFCYPFFATIFILTMGTRCKSFKVPKARFISNLSSFLGFLFCLIVIRYVKLENSKFQRDHFDNRVLFLLQAYSFLYIMGLTLDRFLEFIRRGFGTYFSLWWRAFDFMLLGSFLLALYMFYLGFANTMFEYPKELNRRHWPFHDCELLHDIFMGVGCTLAFWKLFYFMQLIKGLGATIISISRCVAEVINYMVVMATIMIAFAIGVNMIAQPYNDNKAELADGTVRVQDERFISIATSYRFLFWSYFGYLDPLTYGIVVGNAGPDQKPIDHFIVSMATEAVMSVYHSILIITVLNLMISMLVRKSDEVLDNEENEFKYIRACIYSEFIDETTSVPPPFNILYLLVLVVRRLFKREYKFNCSIQNILTCAGLISTKGPEEHSPDYHEKQRFAYERLLRKMFSRYRSSRECHYKTIYRTDNVKMKSNGPIAKIAFMNSHQKPFYPGMDMEDTVEDPIEPNQEVKENIVSIEMNEQESVQRLESPAKPDWLTLQKMQLLTEEHSLKRTQSLELK